MENKTTLTTLNGEVSKKGKVTFTYYVTYDFKRGFLNGSVSDGQSFKVFRQYGYSFKQPNGLVVIVLREFADRCIKSYNRVKSQSTTFRKVR